VSYYQLLESDVHSRGMKVIIQSQVEPAGNGFSSGDPLGLATYYASFPDFASYVNGRAANTLAIAQLAPDFLNFSPEPDTEGLKAAQSAAAMALTANRTNPSFAANVRQLQTTILSAFENARLAGLHTKLKLAVGMGSWEYQLNTILKNELSLAGVDIIDIHVHAINTIAGNDFLMNVLAIANAAKAAGKQPGMDEDWEYKERDDELGSSGSISDAEIEARDHWSFWAPIDQAFIQDMVNTSYYEGMAYFEASAPSHFFAYLDYGNTGGCNTTTTAAHPPSSVCSPTQWDNAENQAVDRDLAHSPAALTSTGSFYAGIIRSSPR